MWHDEGVASCVVVRKAMEWSRPSELCKKSKEECARSCDVEMMNDGCREDAKAV
jgi:hypothetical protein